MSKAKAAALVISIFIIVGLLIPLHLKPFKDKIMSPQSSLLAPKNQQSDLSVEAMRAKNYPGSDLVIEQNLIPGFNYSKYLVSYKSDGLKIYGLLTIPFGKPPQGGWPAILFNHGYITPASYETNPISGQYASYVDAIARKGYIVFKPDFRGNGKSEGSPQGAYYSSAYAVDDLNALYSLKKYKDVNPSKIGAWGHSMGGNVTLRDLVVKPNEIKAAVIWGGVVGDYTQLEHWHDPFYHPSAYELSLRYKYRSNLEQKFKTPETNPSFWNSIDPTKFTSDISTPLELYVGLSDEEVPPVFSQDLYEKMKSESKNVNLFEYPGDNHNISNNFSLAMRRSIEFFDKYLK